MIDFLQNKKFDKDKSQSLLTSDNKASQSSWLRSLLHPINGDKDKMGSIDLLAVAKKQMIDVPVAKSQIVQAAEDKPKTSFNIFAKSNKVATSNKEKLSTGGSEKVRKNFDVNLLPATVRFQSTNKIVFILLFWFVASLIVLSLIYTAILFYGQQITEEGLALEAEIEYLDSEIVKYNSDIADASKWQVKLSAVDSLLRGHVYWTNFFSALEMTTLPEVYYSGFTASLINSDVNLVSYAKSFTTVAEQLIAYEKFSNVFNSFSVSEASLDEGIGINYNALVNLRRSLFYDQSFIKQGNN